MEASSCPFERVFALFYLHVLRFYMIRNGSMRGIFMRTWPTYLSGANDFFGVCMCVCVRALGLSDLTTKAQATEEREKR